MDRLCWEQIRNWNSIFRAWWDVAVGARTVSRGGQSTQLYYL